MVLGPRAPDGQFGSTEVIILLFFVPVPAGMGYLLGIRPFLAAGNATPDRLNRETAAQLVAAMTAQASIQREGEEGKGKEGDRNLG